MEIYKMYHVHLESNMHSVFVGTLWSLFILETLAGLLVIPLNWPECRAIRCGSWGTSSPILWKDSSVLQPMYLPQGLQWESEIDPGIISYHLTLFLLMVKSYGGERWRQSQSRCPVTHWSLRAFPVTQQSRIFLQSRRHRRYRFNPWVRKITWKRAWQPIPVFLLRQTHG